MLKAELRRLYKAKRAALSADEVALFSEQITRQFFTDGRIQAFLAKPDAIVHTYLPIRQQNEVDTWPLIHQLWRDFPQVRTWSSVTDSETHTLQHFQLTASTTLTETKWGIPEPSGTFDHVIGQPDLVIVPLLAFDQQGNRIGYGGGYYDRFLAEVDTACLKIGLSLFDPVAIINGIEATDIRLDVCAVPGSVYYF